MPATLTRTVDALSRALAPRAGSLAVTLFGDVLAPQGNSVWLGSLVAAMERFGLNARQIRTAVFRLGQEGWLAATQVGRRSYYRLTDSGRRQYARAAERIYAVDDPSWDGHWTLVTLGGLEASAREELRRRLGWAGFGALAPGVLAHPQASPAALEETLDELGLRGSVVAWRASPQLDQPLLAQVRSAWRLDELAARYADFVARFQPFVTAIERSATVEPEAAFVLRTLLIHEYRRILLKATALPPALLPAAWPGHTARDLAAMLYRALQGPALLHAAAIFSNEGGALPAPEAEYYSRFGGLARSVASAA